MNADLSDRYARLDPGEHPDALPDWDTMAPRLWAAVDQKAHSARVHIGRSALAEPHRDWRRLLVAAAAFLAVILIGLSIASVSFRSEPSPPATTPPTTTTPTTQPPPPTAELSIRNLLDESDIRDNVQFSNPDAIIWTSQAGDPAYPIVFPSCEADFTTWDSQPPSPQVGPNVIRGGSGFSEGSEVIRVIQTLGEWATAGPADAVFDELAASLAECATDPNLWTYPEYPIDQRDPASTLFRRSAMSVWALNSEQQMTAIAYW